MTSRKYFSHQLANSLLFTGERTPDMFKDLAERAGLVVRKFYVCGRHDVSLSRRILIFPVGCPWNRRFDRNRPSIVLHIRIYALVLAVHD